MAGARGWDINSVWGGNAWWSVRRKLVGMSLSHHQPLFLGALGPRLLETVKSFFLVSWLSETPALVSFFLSCLYWMISIVCRGSIGGARGDELFSSRWTVHGWHTHTLTPEMVKCFAFSSHRENATEQSRRRVGGWKSSHTLMSAHVFPTASLLPPSWCHHLPWSGLSLTPVSRVSL